MWIKLQEKYFCYANYFESIIWRNKVKESKYNLSHIENNSEEENTFVFTNWRIKFPIVYIDTLLRQKIPQLYIAMWGQDVYKFHILNGVIDSQLLYWSTSGVIMASHYSENRLFSLLRNMAFYRPRLKEKWYLTTRSTDDRVRDIREVSPRRIA